MKRRVGHACSRITFCFYRSVAYGRRTFLFYRAVAPSVLRLCKSFFFSLHPSTRGQRGQNSKSKVVLTAMCVCELLKFISEERRTHNAQEFRFSHVSKLADHRLLLYRNLRSFLSPNYFIFQTTIFIQRPIIAADTAETRLLLFARPLSVPPSLFVNDLRNGHFFWPLAIPTISLRALLFLI